MNNASELNGRVALVTGSSRGIGAEIAKRLGSLGADVVLHGRSVSPHLQNSLEAVVQTGAAAKLVSADFVESDCLDEFVQSAWDQFGQIDILINNAGGDVLTGEASNWDFETKLEYLIKADVISTLRLSRMIGARMRKLNNEFTSSIINIGWDQAFQGMAQDSGELFATTKGAIMSMTLSLAQSLAPQVRVNCVAPGWIQTDWGKQASSNWSDRARNESLMNRWGQPEDVANAVAFLASERASFISGQIIRVNGGFKYFKEDN